MANAKGIDISKYQVDTPSLTGRSFVVVRATWQTSKDIRYDKHVRNVLAAGSGNKVLLAYHFGTGDATASAQGKAFLAAAGDKPTLLVLDLEKNRVGTNMSKTKAKNWIAYVKAHDPLKRKIGLYASDGRWPGQIGQDFNWVAKWSATPPSRPWKFWQYRGSPLDLDYFNGTVTQLRDFAAIKTPDIPTPEPPVVEPEPPEETFTLAELEEKLGAASASHALELAYIRGKVQDALDSLNEAM